MGGDELTGGGQLGLALGRRLREQGLDRVEGNSEEWLPAIRRVARLRARAAGVVTSDDLRDYAEEHDFWPHHQNAWGAVFRGAEWAQVGFARSRHPTNHARRISIWKLRNEADNGLA